MNRMTAITMRAGATARAGPGAEPANRAFTSPPPTPTVTSRKVPKKLAEQPPPLVAGVPEVELAVTAALGWPKDRSVISACAACRAVTGAS